MWKLFDDNDLLIFVFGGVWDESDELRAPGAEVIGVFCFGGGLAMGVGFGDRYLVETCLCGCW